MDKIHLSVFSGLIFSPAVCDCVFLAELCDKGDSRSLHVTPTHVGQYLPKYENDSP